MKKLKKKCCWSCGSLSVIGWGKKEGKERFKCNQCGLLFTRNDAIRRTYNRFVWFRKWVLERQIYKTLQRDSGLSKDTLQKTVSYFLSRAPLAPIMHHDTIHLRVDATYFKIFCVVCYKDDLLKHTQLFRFSDRERYEDINEDFFNLLTLGLQIASITCDGHKATLKAIKKTMPGIRCNDAWYTFKVCACRGLQLIPLTMRAKN